MQVFEEQNPGIEDTEERSTTLQQELRYQTRVERMPQRFESFAAVATKDLEMIEEAMESSDEERWQKEISELEVTESPHEKQWQPKTVKRMVSIKNIDCQTEAALLSGHFMNTTLTLIVDDTNNDKVSGEAGHDEGEKLPYRDVQGTIGYETATGTSARKGNFKYKTQFKSFGPEDGAGNVAGDNTSTSIPLVEATDHLIMVWDIMEGRHGDERYRS